MIAFRIFLGIIVLVQIGLLAAILTMTVRGVIDLNRHRRDRLKREASETVADGMSKEFEDDMKRWLDKGRPPSLATNYLLQEGFLTVVRKRDQQIVLHAEVEGILRHFRVGFDVSTGVPRIHNEVTHEVTVVTSEFLDKWAENRS